MVSKWDTDNDGIISRAEFRKEVKLLVPNAIASEIDDLFDSLDDDSGGTLPARASRAQSTFDKCDCCASNVPHNLLAGSLDIEEIKQTMKKLQAAA